MEIIIGNQIKIGGASSGGGANGSIKWTVSTTAPSKPIVGEIWISSSPTSTPVDKVYQVQTLPSVKTKNSLYMLISSGDSTTTEITYFNNDKYVLSFKVYDVVYYNSSLTQSRPKVGVWTGSAWQYYNYTQDLYNAGNVFTDITGGWAQRNKGALNIKDTYNTMMLSAFYSEYNSESYAPSTVSTNKLIDFTLVKKINVTVYKLSFSDTTGHTSALAYFGLSANQTNNAMEGKQISLGRQVSSPKTFTLDVSDVNGNFYPKLYLVRPGSYNSDESKLQISRITMYY